MARQKSDDGGRVAALVENVRAEDQVERREWWRGSPVAHDESVERLGRPAAVPGAGLHQLEGARLPIEERHPRAAGGGGEAARPEPAAEVEGAPAIEPETADDVRDQRL